MRKIVFTALGSALMALSVANAASAAERHHARWTAPQPWAYDNNINLRDSRAEFGPVYPSYPVYDARVWGGAISAPAGR
jgi:hypothetical protein